MLHGPRQQAAMPLVLGEYHVKICCDCQKAFADVGFISWLGAREEGAATGHAACGLCSDQVASGDGAQLVTAFPGSVGTVKRSCCYSTVKNGTVSMRKKSQRKQINRVWTCWTRDTTIH